MTTIDRAAVLLYALLLWLYPPPFRREFGAAMRADFADAAADAWARSRWRGMAALGLVTAGDLARSLPLQWLRSGHLAFTAAAALATYVCLHAAFIVYAFGGSQSAAPQPENDEALFPLLVVMALVPIVGVLLFTWGFLTPALRRTSRRRRA